MEYRLTNDDIKAAILLFHNKRFGEGCTNGKYFSLIFNIALSKNQIVAIVTESTQEEWEMLYAKTE